jgi:tetratricopeptide (TPR) repeat protein
VLDAADRLSLAAQLPLHTADGVRLLLAKVQAASGAGDRATARGFLTAALRAVELGDLENTRVFADLLEEAAQFHQREAEYELAFEHQARAVELLARLFGQDSPAAANARRGLLYIRMGRGDSAADMRAALAAEKQTLIAQFGRTTPELVDIFVLEQYIAVNEGEYETAVHVAAEALEVARKNFPEVSMQVASMRHNLGEALLAGGHYERAATELEKTVELRSKLVDPNHQALLLVRPMLEVARCRIGDPASSARFEQAMATYAELYPQRSFQHAWLAAEFALCALEKGRRTEALQVLQRYPLLEADRARGGDRLIRIERARHALGIAQP